MNGELDFLGIFFYPTGLPLGPFTLELEYSKRF